MNRIQGRPTRAHSGSRELVAGMIVAVAYLGTAKLGLSVTTLADQVTLVWLPSGIALAALLLYGIRLWPAVAIAAFITNVTTPGETVVTALGIAAGNTLAAVLGAWTLRRFGFRHDLDRYRDVLHLITLGAVLSTMLSATIGVLSLCGTGIQPWSAFATLWGTWWLGDAIGIMIVTPPLLVWLRRREPIALLHAWEGVALFGGILLVGLVVQLLFDPPLAATPAEGKFLLFPFVIWAGLRFGQRGTTLIAPFISLAAVLHHEYGARIGLNGPEFGAGLAVWQGFAGVISGTGMLLSAAMAERVREERRRRLDHAVTRILSESTHLGNAVRDLLITTCGMLKWDLGALWRVDEREHLLRCVEIWNRSSMHFPEFEALTRRQTFQHGATLPGRVWASGEPEWIEDMAANPTLYRSSAAAREGLRGALAIPLKVDQVTVGVMELFSRTPREPDAHLLQLLGSLGERIGQSLDRREREEAMRAARDQLWVTTHAMSAAVIRCARDGRCLWASRGFAEWLGRAPERLHGEPLPAILGPSPHRAMQTHIAAALDGRRAEFEAEVDVKGQGMRWIHVVLEPTHEPDGRPDGWVGVISDITERKRLEDELRRNEQRIRSVVDHVVDGIITINESGVIDSFNPAAERMFGYRAAEVVGRNVSMLMPDPYRSRHDSFIGNYLRTGEAKIIGIGREVEGLRKDGSTFPMDLAVSAYQVDGRHHFTGITRDITERKRSEASLEESNRRKDEFLAMLGHELRNPLGALANAAQIMHEGPASARESEWALGIIDRQVENMTRLVDDLLDVSRITRGEIRLQMERVDLEPIIADAVAATRPLMERRNNVLTVESPPEPVHLNADRARIAQLLMNLLNNAARHTGPGGNVRLSVEAEPDGQVAIRIRDTGAGIPADVLPRIFDIFFQGAESEGHVGLGIGLTVVRRLAEMHGGKVEAFSEGPGKGSEFVVRLPLDADAAAAMARPPEPAAPEDHGRRVLVVDDNRDIAESMRLLLDSMGHEVEVALNASEALDKAPRFRPEAVLLDISMPGGDGYTVAKRLREMPETRRVMLVAITGYGGAQRQARSMEAGFDAHFVKPVDLKALRRLLAAGTATTRPSLQ